MQRFASAARLRTPKVSPVGLRTLKSEPMGLDGSLLAQDADRLSTVSAPAQRPAASLFHSFSADSSQIRGTAREAESVSAVAQEACGASHTASRAGGLGRTPTCRPSQGPRGVGRSSRTPSGRPVRQPAAGGASAAGHKWPCDQGGGLPGDRLKVGRWGNRRGTLHGHRHRGHSPAAPTPPQPLGPRPLQPDA